MLGALSEVSLPPATSVGEIKNYLLYKADEDRTLSQETSSFEQNLDAFDDPWWR